MEERILEIILMVKVRKATPAQMADWQIEEYEAPEVSSYQPAQLAELVAEGLNDPELRSQMFAGSGVFLDFDEFGVVHTGWSK